jgi:hypothetical protein
LIVSVFLFVLIAQNSWAVQITHVTGAIYAETKTNCLVGSNDKFDSANGWNASGGAELHYNDSSDELLYYAQASGQQISGESGNNHARFILHSAAQSENGDTTQAFYTESTVRSGSNAGDMLEFQLKADPGEEGKKVALTAKAVLDGTIKITRANKSSDAGEAEIDFIFEIYKEDSNGKKVQVMSFTYSNTLLKDKGLGSNRTVNEILPGKDDPIGDDLNTTDFMVGDSLYVYFKQTAKATVYNSYNSSGQAFAVQSTSDVISVAIDAQIIPNPEPSSLILLGFGFLGLLIGVPGIKKTFGKNA